MNYSVRFSPAAQADLYDLYDYIAERDGAERAIGYIDRIEQWCRGLVAFPERGLRRNDLRAGLRVIGFERRVTIAFRVVTEDVIIPRILYAGRDLDRAFSRGA